MTKAEEIEKEITDRFNAATYVGMTHNEYLRVLAAELIKFVSERITESGSKP